MGEQESVTARHDEVQAGPAPGPPPGGPGRGPLGWLRRLSRAARLAVISGVAVLVVAGALLALGAVSGGGTKPVTPPRAPALTLAVLGHPGRHLSLAHYAGRPLVVNFFASWCTPCQKETPLIASYYRAAHGRVTVLGVDVNDSAASALRFTRKAGVSYPVVTDPPPMKATFAYGVPGLPATFFLNSQHRIVKRVYGAVTQPELQAGVALMTRPPGRG